MNTETDAADRALLVLAAKAAGFGAPDTGGSCWTESEYPRGSGKHGALWNYVGHCDTAELWNPLTDDGDLLRMAVKLEIRLSVSGRMAIAEWWCGPLCTNLDSEVEAIDGDACAALRRAGVRAAAAIGEAGA